MDYLNDVGVVGRTAAAQPILQTVEEAELERLPYPGANHPSSGIHPVRIHPAWAAPKQPPLFARGPDPAWGGPAGNYHQIPPPTQTKDCWLMDFNRNVLIRFHITRRIKLYNPAVTRLPDGLQVQDLTGRRRTLAMFEQPTGGFNRLEDR